MVYTDDCAALARVVSREQERGSALSIEETPREHQSADPQPRRQSRTTPPNSPLDVAARQRPGDDPAVRAARVFGTRPDAATLRALFERTLPMMKDLDPPDIPAFRNLDRER
jgi:hypothetical protein